MFFIIGIFIAVFLSFLLIIKKNKSRADKILGIWLLLISISEVFNYALITEVIFQYPSWLGIDFGLPTLIGLFLFFYVREVTGNPLNSLRKLGFYILPTMLIYLLAIPFYTLPGVEKIYIFKNDGIGFEWYVILNNLAIAISGLAYSIWSLILIKNHRLKIQDTFSNTDKKELNWLRILTIGFGLVWLTSFFFNNVIIFKVVAAVVLIIGVFGINQLSIFNASNIPEQDVVEEPKVSNQSVATKTIEPKSLRSKYKKSGLNEEMALAIYSGLNELVEETAIFKKEELTLVELAKELKTHPNHLSQVINEKEGKNFYNYINSLRIKEFIKIASLPENKKYTMISLAYDCGFSTKSTFNKHFKLQTGKTPTEFFNS